MSRRLGPLLLAALVGVLALAAIALREGPLAAAVLVLIAAGEALRAERRQVLIFALPILLLAAAAAAGFTLPVTRWPAMPSGLLLELAEVLYAARRLRAAGQPGLIAASAVLRLTGAAGVLVGFSPLLAGASGP